MDNYSDIIDQYFEGSMSEEEKKIFLERINKDKELKKEFDFQKELYETIQDKQYINLRKKLIARNKQISATAKTVNFKSTSTRNLNSIAAAAAMIIIFLGLMYIFISKRSVQPDKLAQRYYKPAIVYEIQRSNNEDEAQKVNIAFELYNQGQFAKALTAFESNPDNITAIFYSGICNYELKNYASAEENFKAIIKQSNNFYTAKAEWYLALNYLKVNKIGEARKLLEKISESDNVHAKEAKEIIKALD